MGLLRYTFIVVGVFALKGALTGCSLFSNKEERLVEPGFRHRAANPSEALPLPADIAHDIESISESGRVVLRRQLEPHGIGFEETSSKDLTLVDGPTPEIEGEDKGVFSSDIEGPVVKSIRDRKSGPLGFRAVSSRSHSGTGDSVPYRVERGDTLMKISFEKHGDYLRWREIYSRNRDKMAHYTKMPVGITLIIDNVEYVYIQREGEPYLIKKGDTLPVIAERVYGDSSLWKKIWENNPQLIRSPSKLYAGFTLYYPPKDQL